MQQDGGHLFLQREESTPDGPHQDLPRITVPGGPGQHPDTMPVFIRGALEKIFRLDSNTYVVYSLGKINTNHVCPKTKSISAIQISSGKTIRISPGCHVRTMDHLITADDNEETEIHSKWLDWTWTIGQLFQQPENEKVTKAIEQLRQRISGKFDADTLINELQQMTLESKSEQFNHWDFSIPGAMIGGAIITLLLLCCCWRL